ncbi:Dabb family protein [Microbacterium rhizomatis]|uniref:Dabb family protein n=1 Tax=Microbacterium rhizomatis TaxID=1631477 RepID=A0A5J5J261_9MICO|nr:Dabb family protein [Microbacterium rhizomatis]KAA9108094.1 Dabb family protein [Microbacterium rhizomatis]
MIFHINRLTYKTDVTPEEREAGLELLRRQGESIPAVKSFVVGPELGADFEYGAVFVIEDLDGYWEYLTHPAHFESEKSGLHLVERFEAFDTTDSDDPGMAAKIAALHRRSYEENPSIADLIAQVPDMVVPDGSSGAH